MILAPLTSTTRRLLFAAGLVLGLGSAMPAMAADNAQFGFTFGTGNGSFGFSIGNGGFIGRHFVPPPPHPVCLNNEQLRNRLRAEGYRFITFGNRHQNWIHTTARRNGQRFSFEINNCTGAIANLQAKGSVPGGFNPGGFPPGGFNNGGFNTGGFPPGGFAGGSGFPGFYP